MPEFLGALDQGTTSSRFVVFDHEAKEVARCQLEHRQLLPRPGWVEHDPEEIWEQSRSVIEGALATAGLGLSDLTAIGIANQRETTIVWDRRTGQPIAPAIVWQDARNEELVAALGSEYGEVVRERSGLPLSAYPSATKLRWLLDNVPGARRRAEMGEVLFGTVDTWLVWRLTGEHVTDVTNASRTMLMNLERLEWDETLLEIFGVPRSMLPRIGASTRSVGELAGNLFGDTEISVTGVLGDQQAAMFGQGCLARGDTKNTYGTGSFLLVNTGGEIVRSRHGLITTVCFQLKGEAPIYALEGSVAVTGAAVQWLRDQLGIIQSASDVEELAASVADSEGLYFVPAFSGLFAPWWRPDARGVIVGMSRSHHRGHLARATLESVGFQCADIVRALEEDLGHRLTELRVDGGMTENALCMQLQANILGVPVVRAGYAETTVRGAALAAGLGAGFWTDREDLPSMSLDSGGRWEPAWSAEERAARSRRWRLAVERSLGWQEIAEA